MADGIVHMGRRATITFGILLACCPCASALNPSLDINRYAHTAWTIRGGFFKVPIQDIAQTPDGYLWLATASGLLRFDGVRTVPWQPPAGQRLYGGSVLSLLAARDGRLWIGTTQGLASWKDGKLTNYQDVTGKAAPLLEDREGTVWVGGFAGSTGRLCAIQKGGTHCYGADGGFGREVRALYEDSRGYLWAGGATGVWQWKPDPPKFYRTPYEVLGLMEGDDGGLLIVTRQEIRRLVEGKSEVYRFPGARRPSPPLPTGPQFKNLSKGYGSTPVFSGSKLLRDRDGGLWLGTVDGGVFRVHQGKADQFGRSDGLSGDFVHRLFEDREGNVWVITDDGLDRFRDFAIPTISVAQGLSTGSVSCVLAARDGSIWLGTYDGLNRWNNEQITVYRKRNSGLPDDSVVSIFEDYRGRIWVSTHRGIAYFENGRFTPVSEVAAQGVHSIAGDKVGNLWLGLEQGLFHLQRGGVERISWERLGRTEKPWALLLDPTQGGLWLGFGNGVAYFKDGQIRASYSPADGLGNGRANGLQLDRDGTLWVATEGGLSRVKNGRIATLTSKNGLPCDEVHWVMEDDDHAFWLYTACGLVRIARSELDGWATDPKRTIQTTVFDSSDGASVHSFAMYGERVAKSSDGKIWFLPLDGVSVIDPRHLPFNKLTPPVHIEQLTADRKTQDAASNLRLPPLVRNLEIDYTALSLVAPEKIHFRYKLEGQDRDWTEVINERRAFYNNLPPRNYRFRVIASNNSGVWNEAGDSLDFSIAPAYYQSAWFEASCVTAFLGLLWGLYQFRLRQIGQEFNARLEERVNERTRIARELHDTLLQSFHGLLFRFQAARNMLPRRPEEAVQALDEALERTEQAIAEGRDAIKGLRASTVVTNELAQAVKALGDELASQDSAKFHVMVEGPPRDLHPILRDDVYAIVREAVKNAFRHAQARNIEVEITYNASSFQLRIRDDGKGIDPGIVAQGRAGHFGAQGMHERAQRIGGKLEVWTGTGTGTEIELSIPGSTAYGTSPSRTVLGLFRKKAANS